MPNTCILTDSTAQITHPTFTGQHRVKVISSDFPGNQTPDVETIQAHFAACARNFDTIIMITSAGSLSPLARVAAQAASQHGGWTSVSIIDSQNFGAGLGILVQQAAEAAEAGAPPRDIEQLIRATIPRIYSIYCVPSLQGLARSGLLSQSQSTVSAILGVMPIFSLEAGQLTSFHKVRTTRHLLESFQEFVGEYEAPRQIALVKGREIRLRLRPLRQFIADNFAQATFTEHILNPPLSHLLGNDAVGMVILD